MRFIYSVLLAALLLVPAAHAQSDEEGVRLAVLDYVEGFYEGDSTRLVQSVHSSITKYGYARRGDDPAYNGQPMSYQQMMDYANWVAADASRKARPDAPKTITLYDVQDQTASAKLDAWWGTDYLLLGKYDGTWMIKHVLWQSPPPQ